MFNLRQSNPVVIGDMTMTDVLIGKGRFQKQLATLFHENEEINIFDIIVGKGFSANTSDTVILPHHDIGKITRSSLYRKLITYLLHFDVDNRAISQLNQNVHDYKGTFFYELASFHRKNFTDLHRLAEECRDQFFHAIRVELAIRDRIQGIDESIVGGRQT